jgi:hypothetical protein
MMIRLICELRRSEALRGLIAGLLALTLFITVIAVPVQARTLQYIKTLTAESPQADLNFGQSVAISRDRIVVSEHLRDSMIGRVYLFDSDGNYIKSIQSSSPQPGADFGWSVAISGDLIVVGEPQPGDSGGTGKGQGRAHIFDSNGNFIKTLQSPSPHTGAWFGSGVAVGGDRIIVGESENLAGGQGRAHIFDSNGNFIKTLQSPSPQANAWFGYSVATSGDRIVVGEPLTSSQTGRAHIFDSNGNFIKTLQSQSSSPLFFGWSVAISGDLVMVGEPLTSAQEGRANILDSNGNLIKTLQSPSPQAGAWFGWSVATSGNFIIVGETRGANMEGRAYLFSSGGNLLDILQSPSPQAGDYAFGWSVAVSGVTVVVSEPTADVSGTSDEGRAYVYNAARPVGGILVPVNKLKILTPYLALAGLVIAGSATIVAKKRSKA